MDPNGLEEEEDDNGCVILELDVLSFPATFYERPFVKINEERFT